jgi:hypothetical protein
VVSPDDVQDLQRAYRCARGDDDLEAGVRGVVCDLRTEDAGSEYVTLSILVMMVVLLVGCSRFIGMSSTFLV